MLAPQMHLRAATLDDVEYIVALKERVLRADLERHFPWNPDRSRARVMERFSPEHSHMIVVDGAVAGTITLRPDGIDCWLEMFYLEGTQQGRGVGSAVLRSVLAAEPGRVPNRLQVLVGSPAQRLYERHGFVVEHDDGIDIWMRRQLT